ncbi:hypothetical protein AB1K54_06020 [Microbacterium sp. BWT-B31]|uniref:hypothetical protein n=1 Tax=Microbacterium sp. BWT-B31 TaxID=3232072 RepID=UPI003526DBE0
MIIRALTAVVGVVATMVVMSGCSAPAPSPTPTPTAVFASEDEAFAAAEETYRAYIDAVNARRTDPNSSPAPSSFLIGDALADSLAVDRDLEASGIRAVGDTGIERIDRNDAAPTHGRVVIGVCLNSQAVRAVNEPGQDVTPDERPDFALLRASLIQVDDRLLIEQSVTSRADGC